MTPRDAENIIWWVFDCGRWAPSRASYSQESTGRKDATGKDPHFCTRKKINKMLVNQTAIYKERVIHHDQVRLTTPDAHVDVSGWPCTDQSWYHAINKAAMNKSHVLKRPLDWVFVFFLPVVSLQIQPLIWSVWHVASKPDVTPVRLSQSSGNIFKAWGKIWHLLQTSSFPGNLLDGDYLACWGFHEKRLSLFLCSDPWVS